MDVLLALLLFALPAPDRCPRSHALHEDAYRAGNFLNPGPALEWTASPPATHDRESNLSDL